MLETFSAGVNFKSLLLQHGDMSVIQNFKVIIEKASADRSHDTFAGTLTPEYTPSVTSPRGREQHVVLSTRALDALSATYRDLFNCPLPSEIVCHKKHIIGKVSLTTRAESKRDCHVFFRSTAGDFIAPGMIQYIASISPPSQNDKTVTFCIIERYGHLPDGSLSNPFLSYKAFGASLWSSTMSPTLEAVPIDHIVCHAIYRPWVKGVILFKALNRVSIPISVTFCVTDTLKRLFNSSLSLANIISCY